MSTPGPTTRRAPVSWRPCGGCRRDPGALSVIDATSGAAGGRAVRRGRGRRLLLRAAEVFASDGGLWLALVFPAAVERIERIAASGRWVPDFLSLTTRSATADSTRRSTRRRVRDPGMLESQVEWLQRQRRARLGHRPHQGLLGAALRLGRGRAYATPYVTDPANRSQVVADHRLRRHDRRLGDREDAARQRGRRRRALPQARPQPAAGGLLPGGRPRRRQQADRLRRARRRAPRLTSPSPRSGTSGGCREPCGHAPGRPADSGTSPGSQTSVTTRVPA